MYPLIADIKNRPVLVVGAGNVGVRKINTLLDAGAALTVISTDCPESIRSLSETHKVKLIERDYQEGDCRGFFLVIGATNDRSTNELISKECEENGILVNIVDVPELCSFYVPSIVDRGALKIAITTSGKSPAFARELRKELEQHFGPEYESFIERIGEMRDIIKLQYPDDHETRLRAIEEMFKKEYSEFRKRPDK